MTHHLSPLTRRLRAAFRLAPLACALCLLAPLARAEGTLDLATATVADLQAAMSKGTLTSEKLVQLYLERIEAYDKKGPAINAVIMLNPKALETAKALDVERKAGKVRGPLHGIPIVLKDNYNTFDLPTTAGSLLLKGSVPPADAYMVKKLRDAGAIVLAKLNLSEFASGAGGPNGFSSMGGQTHNPHDLMRGPAGSSGGTGASIAGVFAQLGLGTDTGGSIRGPSSANGIVGLKPTRGLVSRAGIVPLALSFDTGGPMARSVYDIAAALTVMTGVDSNDPATKPSASHLEKDYTKFLKIGSLKGARIGVARDFFKQNAETDRIMEESIAKLKALGATIVDPINFPEYLLKARAGIYQTVLNVEFRAQIGDYLKTLSPAYPKSLAELIAKAEKPESGYTNPWRLEGMKRSEASGTLDDPTYLAAKNEGLAMITSSVLAIFAQNKLDALVYPTSPQPARLIPPPPRREGGGRGEGESATNFANMTGFPDLIVPAGMTSDGLPVTISFFGPAYSEPKLLSYGYDFEQATHAIKLPKNTPELPDDKFTY